jgi:amino acid transporter
MTAIDAPQPLVPPIRRGGLRREIGFISLLWVSGGSIIGSGWLFSAQGALASAGPAALISWVVGGVAILLLALVHAELGAMYPVAGGTARFPHIAFGGAAGASFGWFSWLQAVTVAPIEVLAVIQYAQHYSFASGWLKLQGGQHVLTATGLLVAIGLMAVFTAINFLGVRRLARTNSAATWWKVAVPVLAIVALAATHFHTGNFTAANGFNPYGAHGILAAVSTSGIIFALLGFEQADQLAGESANPRRDIPRAVIGAVTIGLVIYLLLQVVFLAALPAAQVQGSWATAGYTKFSGPFAELATLVGLGWLATILYIDAVVSPGGTGLIYTTASSRVSYGLSRNGYVPSVYESTTSRAIPWFGLITAFVVGCVCFLPFPSWRSLVGLITSASVLMYAGAPLALGALRRRLPDAERPYRLPSAPVIAPVAFVVANFLILWSGWVTDYKLGIAILIGYVVLAGNRLLRLNPIAPVLNWRAAGWLPVYLVGMGLIVYLSDFGPLANPWFPLWWDMVAVAVFSLAIYAWAQRVALPTEEIEHLIASVPEEAPEVVLDGAGSGALDLAPEDDGRVVQRQAERRPASGQEA